MKRSWFSASLLLTLVLAAGIPAEAQTTAKGLTR